MATNARMGLAGVLLCIASTQSSGATVASPPTSITFGASVGSTSSAPDVKVIYSLRSRQAKSTIAVINVTDTNDWLSMNTKICVRRRGGNGERTERPGDIRYYQRATGQNGFMEYKASIVTNVETGDGELIDVSTDGKSACTGTKGKITTFRWVLKGMSGAHEWNIFYTTELQLPLEFWLVNV